MARNYRACEHSNELNRPRPIGDNPFARQAMAA
jgi:hypothetical protein